MPARPIEEWMASWLDNRKRRAAATVKALYDSAPAGAQTAFKRAVLKDIRDEIVLTRDKLNQDIDDLDAS